MVDVGKGFRRAAIFGASGGIGAALAKAFAQRGTEVRAGARDLSRIPTGAGISPFAFDLDEEDSIAAAARTMSSAPPDCVIVATGVLTLPDGRGPERSYKRLDPLAMQRVLYLNTVGPALIAKHVLPLLPREGRSVFAALSARVGSIGDNRLGGWHSYRASKAALNMLIRNWAIEVARTHSNAVICGLHPGTVDTALSEPFQKNVPPRQLFTAERSAAALLAVIEDLTPQESGKVFDWSAKPIPA